MSTMNAAHKTVADAVVCRMLKTSLHIVSERATPVRRCGKYVQLGAPNARVEMKMDGILAWRLGNGWDSDCEDYHKPP